MRRKFLCVLAAVLLLTSCAAPVAETQTPEPEILEDPDGLADLYMQTILDSQEDGESYIPLPPEDREFYLTQVYGIPEGGWSGAALYTGGGADAREIAVLSGLDPEQSYAAAAAMEEYRKNRVADFTGYFPEQAALVERGVVMKGNLAVLLICTDPEAAQKAIKKELSHLVLQPFDPEEETSEPYDWTDYVNEKGWKLCDPPGKFDMTPYDTSSILTAWETGDESGLSEKDAAILAKCREIFGAYITEGMTDLQKEAALHDWLVENCAYDQTVHDPKTPMGREDNLDPYGLLVGGYGICLSYATTFQLLMDMAGVECITVVGASAASSSDHAWNMVRLEGEWYCVDATWDDTTIPHPEAYTREELSQRHHRYFNVTSQKLRDSDHQWDYEKIPEATATRFRWDGTGTLPQ